MSLSTEVWRNLWDYFLPSEHICEGVYEPTGVKKDSFVGSEDAR